MACMYSVDYSRVEKCIDIKSVDFKVTRFLYRLGSAVFATILRWRPSSVVLQAKVDLLL